MGKNEYYGPHGSMDKHTPSEFTFEEYSGIIRKLSEQLMRHEKLLGEIMTILQCAEKTQYNLVIDLKELSKINVLVSTLESNTARAEQNVPEDASALPSAWMPSQVKGTRVMPIQSSVKIRKIESLPANYHKIDKLQNSWLGRVYKSHLKRYSAFRVFVHWIWRNGYRNLNYINDIAMLFPNSKKKRWHSIIKLREYVKKGGMQTYKLADATRVETPEPKVFPACDQGYLASPHDQYEFPEIFVTTIKNAMTYGGTNLIIADGEVVCHDLYDFRRDYTSEELHGRNMIDPNSGYIRWLLHDEAPEPIPVAATFVDACAPNYAHWMTEVLPRVAIFCADERFKNIPIVVNDGLHKNIMESLFLVAGADREIITLPIGRAMAVEELYLTSVAGYVPFERRTNKLSGHAHGMFSPQAFQILCNHLNPMAQRIDEEAWPEKIFLRRVSGTRKVNNATEIEKLLVAKGYVIVEPEKLTFSQQVQLFSNAKTIVGSSGAALANIIFTSRNAKIFILIGKYPETSYWYWQNIACASGKTVSYVLGKMDNSAFSGMHTSFFVDFEDLISSSML